MVKQASSSSSSKKSSAQESKVVEQTQTLKPATVVTTTTSAPPKPASSKTAKKLAELTKNVVSTPVVTDSNTVVALSTEAPVASDEPQITESFVEIQAKIQQLSVLANSIKSDIRQLEKKCLKEIKVAQKSSNKKKKRTTNRAPSGFVKPTRISDELASFLSVPIGTELARTAVTSEIDKYVKANSLQDKENGRKIIADSKLLSLLKIDSTVELTYFNLQKYMRCHFEKSGGKVEGVSVQASASV